MASSQWDQLADALIEVLPEGTCERHHKLLSQILEDWSRTDLREHLSRDSRATTNGRIKKLETVKKKAQELGKALNKLDEHDRAAVVEEIVIAEGRRPVDVRRAEYTDRSARLDQEPDFLAKLGAIAPKKFGPGQPQNLRAYLVLLDTAALFEWLTGIKATREVDRGNKADIGPFYLFASILWPAIFGNDLEGLSAAMKNWATWSKRYGDWSPLIVNMDLRHPAWGVFKG